MFWQEVAQFADYTNIPWYFFLDIVNICSTHDKCWSITTPKKFCGLDTFYDYIIHTNIKIGQ